MQPSLVTRNQSPLLCGVSPVRHTYYWLTCEKKVTIIQRGGPLCVVKLPQKHKMEGCSDFVPQAGWDREAPQCVQASWEQIAERCRTFLQGSVLLKPYRECNVCPSLFVCWMGQPAGPPHFLGRKQQCVWGGVYDVYVHGFLFMYLLWRDQIQPGRNSVDPTSCV